MSNIDDITRELIERIQRLKIRGGHADFEVGQEDMRDRIIRMLKRY